MRPAIPLTLLALATTLAPALQARAPVTEASGVPRPMTEIEAQVKLLSSGGDASARFDALMTWLGLSSTCPTGDCKSFVSSKWSSASLDPDPDEEKILTITTHGAGACPSANLEVIAFDSTPKGWVGRGHARLRLSGGAKPVTQVSALHVHSAKVMDLLLEVEGQCAGGTREKRMKVVTFEAGPPQELFASSDYLDERLASHTLTGTPPVRVELNDGKSTTKLTFDVGSNGYDSLVPYNDAMKSAISKSDDATLSMAECSAPIATQLAVDCNLEGAAKVQVAVQKGKAIGATLSVDPAAPEVLRCLRRAVVKLTWKSAAGVTSCVRTFKVG